MKKNDSTAPLSLPVFRQISAIAARQDVPAFVVGGYVRDFYLGRPSTDIDVVVVGSGIGLAEELGREATVEELAAKMKMTEEEIKDIMKLTLDALSVSGE